MGRENKSLVILLGFGVFGIVLSGLVGYLYDQGVVIDEIATASTPIAEIQAAIIIFFLAVGIVMGWKN